MRGANIIRPSTILFLFYRQGKQKKEHHLIHLDRGLASVIGVFASPVRSLRQEVERDALLHDGRHEEVERGDIAIDVGQEILVKELPDGVVPGDEAGVESGHVDRGLGVLLERGLVLGEDLGQGRAVGVRVGLEQRVQAVDQVGHALQAAVHAEARVGRHLVGGVADEHTPALVPLLDDTLLDVAQHAPLAVGPNVGKGDPLAGLAARELDVGVLGRQRVLVFVREARTPVGRRLVQALVHQEVLLLLGHDQLDRHAAAVRLVAGGRVQLGRPRGVAVQALVGRDKGLVGLLGGLLVHHTPHSAAHAVGADDHGSCVSGLVGARHRHAGRRGLDGDDLFVEKDLGRVREVAVQHVHELGAMEAHPGVAMAIDALVDQTPRVG